MIKMTEDSSSVELNSDMEVPHIPESVKEKTPRKKAIIISSILIAVSAVLAIVFGIVFNLTYLKDIGIGKNGVFTWFPGNFIVEFSVIWFLPIVTTLLVVLFVRFLSVFYIWLHKIVKYGSYTYSLVEMDNSLVRFKEVIRRSIVPILFSFSIGYWFVNWIYNVGGETIELTFQFFLFAFFLSPIVIIIVAPLWLLEDAGIISIKKRKEGERKLPDIEGPSNFFANFLTGSAYSLAAITIVTVIIRIIQDNSEPLIGALVYILVMMIMLWISIVYLFEVFIQKRKDRFLEKLPENLVDPEPKVLTNQLTVAKLKTIDAILSEDD